MANQFESQLDSIISDFEVMRKTSAYKDLSDLPKDERQSLVTRAVAAIHRISGMNSPYTADVARLIKLNPGLHVHTSSVIGVVKALRHDVNAGYLQTFTALVHAAVFADFIQMSKQLHESHYKDAAAVVCGSTLETHLREMCKKFGIDTKINGRPKKADQMNSELAKANAYSALDQKSVTAWLALRNKAAHGEYDAYDETQVELLISSVEQFISRTPA